MDILGQAEMTGMALGGAGSLLEHSRSRAAADRAQAIQSGRALANDEQGDVDSRLREVAADFVSVFMNQMVKSMRSTVQENQLASGGKGERFFQELLDSEYSKGMAAGSGYGLTDLVHQSLVAKLRLAEAAPESERSAAVPAVEVGESV
ncbi:MAG: rod-binding protein [Planctomycetota bacterium]|jgi:Rod binding domain-containing protein|nr:rod-binding protein [Planctomycetota bacterium]